MCHLQHHQDKHKLADCQEAEAKEFLEYVNKMKDGTQGKRRFEMRAACYDCGAPQKICNKWRAKTTRHGKFERCQWITCQYLEVIIPVVAILLEAWDSRKKRVIYEWIRRESVDGTIYTNG